MKKISVLIILALLFSVLSIIPATAVAPEWTYQCAKSVYDVNVNGKVEGTEWDDAVELVVNNDSEIFKKYGFWQNTAANGPIPTSDLNVTYKLKWDDKNLYILEVRYDKHFTIHADVGPEPWNHSGTLLFLSYDAANYDEPSGDGTYEIFWVSQDGKPLLSGRYGSGKTLFTDTSDPAMAGWVTSAGKNGDTYTFEAAIPWKTMQDTVTFPTPAEGVKIRFTPVVSAYLVKDADAFGADWNQLDFYVDTSAPDNVTGEGGLELTGPIIDLAALKAAADAEAAAAAAAAAPVEAAPAVVAPVVTAAPQTGDNSMGIIIFVIALVGSAAVISRRRIAQK